jgi:hypothetical protein
MRTGMRKGARTASVKQWMLRSTAILCGVLVLAGGASPAYADAGGPEPPGALKRKFDGTFSSGLRTQKWADPGSHPVPVSDGETVISIPPGSHDSIEADLTIHQGDNPGQGSYGVFMDVAVTPRGGIPDDHAWMGIFSNNESNSTATATAMRLTFDHRVPPDQTMDLHVRCGTIQRYPDDSCAIANVRGFLDTPGWQPVAWNGPRSHAFGIYAKEMPIVVVGDSAYGPPITSDGDNNPFLGIERDLSGYGVKIRSSLVTLPTFTETTPFEADVRWRRSTDAVPPNATALEVDIRFVSTDAPDAEVPLITIPRGVTTSAWQTRGSGPLPAGLSGKTGYFVIEPRDFSLGPVQAVGLDSLTFYLNGQPIDIPLANCMPGQNEVSIYEHTFYQGRCVVKGIGTYNGPLSFSPLLNDSASSIRVGANVQALLARDNNLTGIAEIFTADDNDFHNNTAIGNDTMSSFIVQPRGCMPGQNEVAIYEHSFYQGRCVVKGIGTYNGPLSFRPLLNDSASSIRVGANVQALLARDNNLTGPAETFMADENDFRYTAIGSDTMSSFKVQVRQSELTRLIDAQDRPGIRKYMSTLTLEKINAEVAALDQLHRDHLADVVLDFKAFTLPEQRRRDQLLAAMRTVLNKRQLGFYAEVWSYTPIETADRSEFVPPVGPVRLQLSIFDSFEVLRNTLLHESFHAFNAHEGGPPGFSALNEGSAIWVFKEAFGSTGKAQNWAEATYGTKLWYRDIAKPPVPDYPVRVPVNPTEKLSDEYRYLSGRDASHLPWGSQQPLERCYQKHWERIPRGQLSDPEYLEQAQQATDDMVADPECNP